MESKVLRLLTSVLILALAAGGAAGQTAVPSSEALTRCSTRFVDSPIRGALAADGDLIYLGTANGEIAALESKGLALLWRSELGGVFASEILLVGSGILVVTNPLLQGNGTPDVSTIRLINKQTGLTTWSLKIPFAEQYYLDYLNGGIVAVSSEGAAFLIEIGPGVIRWQLPAYGSVTAPPSSGSNRVAFGTADKRLIAISKDGGLIARHEVDFVPTVVSFAADNGILAGDERGNVYRFGAEGPKPIWRFKSGAGVSSVIEVEEGILVTSLDNFVYFISNYNGDVIWKRRLPGRVLEGGLTLGGYVVVLIHGENSGYVLELEKGRIIGVLATGNNDLISRAPIFVNSRKFVLATANSVDVYSIGTCALK